MSGRDDAPPMYSPVAQAVPRSEAPHTGPAEENCAHDNSSRQRRRRQPELRLTHQCGRRPKPIHTGQEPGRSQRPPPRPTPGYWRSFSAIHRHADGWYANGQPGDPSQTPPETCSVLIRFTLRGCIRFKDWKNASSFAFSPARRPGPVHRGAERRQLPHRGAGARPLTTCRACAATAARATKRMRTSPAHMPPRSTPPSFRPPRQR